MASQPLKVSVLHGSGSSDPAFTQTLTGLDSLQLLPAVREPETFLNQSRQKSPDLLLIELDGLSSLPEWLEPLLGRLPRGQVVICSANRDPDFLIRLMALRPGGFLPLPLNPEALLPQLERVLAERAKASQTVASQILAVTGTKGGGGITTVVTNLAIALASLLHRQVILLDLGRPFPQVGQFLDLKSPHTIKDLADSSGSLDPIFLQKIVQKHKSGLDILMGYPNYYLDSRGFPDFPALDKILQNLRSSYQWICLDLGSWLDPLYIRLLQKADQVLLLTQLTVPDLQNLKAIQGLFREVNIEDQKVKIVVNHYTKEYILGLRDVETIGRRPVFATIPHDYQPLMEAINQGVPLGKSAPRSKLWRRLLDMAKDLVEEQGRQRAEPAAARPAAPPNGLFRRLFL